MTGYIGHNELVQGLWSLLVYLTRTSQQPDTTVSSGVSLAMVRKVDGCSDCKNIDDLVK